MNCHSVFQAGGFFFPFPDTVYHAHLSPRMVPRRKAPAINTVHSPNSLPTLRYRRYECPDAVFNRYPQSKMSISTKFQRGMSSPRQQSFQIRLLIPKPNSEGGTVKKDIMNLCLQFSRFSEALKFKGTYVLVLSPVDNGNLKCAINDQPARIT